MRETDNLILDGKIEIPYRWSAGKAAGLFLTALRDEKVFLATRCGACRRTVVPPENYCGRCYAELDEWVEVGPGGVVTGLVVVREPKLFGPADPPYAVARIRLDGADTDLLHLVRPSDVERLPTGSRVRPVFKEDRQGHVLDVLCFEPESSR